MQQNKSGFLDPASILKNLGLESGDMVADFGAGHGYFVIAAARIVGNDGKVFALDIQKDVLEIIRAKAKAEYLLNIETIKADVESPRGSTLKDSLLDFVMVNNALFQNEDQSALLREAYRVLREGGKLAIIEWDDSQNVLGPPANLRVKKEDAKMLSEDAGFELEKEFEAGQYHYGLLFTKV